MSTVNSNSSAPDQTVVAKDRLQAERINTDWARDGATLQPGSSDWARDGGTVTPNGLVNTPAATSKVRVAKRVVEEQACFFGLAEVARGSELRGDGSLYPS